jgi:NADH-ubiquinone oxidoreductase chain 4
MGVLLMGAFSNTLQGIIGSIIFGLAHGFVSPALFICCGAILYDRCGTRTINYYRGLIMYLPLFSFFFFLFILANMGTPLTGNFIGEFMSLLGAFQQNIFLTALGATGIVLSATYSIFMFNRIAGGFINPFLKDIPDLFRKEFHLLFPLLLFTLLLGIYPNFVISDIEFSISSLLLIFNFQIFNYVYIF